MPQIWPMNWILLFTMFIVTFILFLTFIYFFNFYLKVSQTSDNTPKESTSTLDWKW